MGIGLESGQVTGLGWFMSSVQSIAMSGMLAATRRLESLGAERRECAFRWRTA